MLLVLVMLFVVRVLYILKIKIPGAVMKTEEMIPASDKLKKEWKGLSYSGTNPYRVVSLGATMAVTMSEYEAAKHMESVFYSQIKHLAKKLQVPSTIAFVVKSRQYKRLALLFWKRNPVGERKPIDFEVLGSIDFGLAAAPVIGPIIGRFGYKKRALEFLYRAETALGQQPVTDPMEAGLIWAKLWRLTHKNIYRLQVEALGLRPDMDQYTLARIAKHLGFASVDKMFKSFKTRAK